MNDRLCQTTRDRLPLHVEGDLPAADASAVTRHLEGCESCRQIAAALRESQAFLRSASPAPFDDADLADLRREVLARLPEGRVEASSWLSWLVQAIPGVAVLAVVLLGALSYWLLAPNEGPQAPVARGSVGRPDTIPPGPKTVAEAPVASMPTAPAVAAPAVAARTPPRPGRRPRPARPEPIVVVDVSPENALQIQLQTQNPNIRILWMVPKPAPEKASDKA